MRNKIKHKIVDGAGLKMCFKCKVWKELSCFSKNKNTWDSLQHQCKSCSAQYRKDNCEQIEQYRQDNREQIAEYQKQYRQNNREQIAAQSKQYRKDNREQIKQYRKDNREQAKQYRKDNREQIAEKQKQYRKDNHGQIVEYQKQYYQDNCEQAKQYHKDNREQIVEKQKQYRQSFALYDTYAHRIEFCEEARRVSDNPELLEVKCAYCGKWLKPTNLQIQNRLQVFNGRLSGENRFYCSENCKEACPIYNQNKYPKGFKSATSREVVPLLRQLVLKRDDYTCQKCGATTETAQLHVHHEKSYALNKIMANDPDNCLTLCKKCHKEVHQQDGCRYVDLKC